MKEEHNAKGEWEGKKEVCGEKRRPRKRSPEQDFGLINFCIWILHVS